MEMLCLLTFQNILQEIQLRYLITMKELLHILNTIQGNGSFVTSGTANLTLPGLHVEGIGEISLPLSTDQAKELSRVATKAPFGKGSKTITDTTVRSAWQIDADDIHFENPAWKSALKKLQKTIQAGLGIEGTPINLSLYKLLLYEKGDFFLPHKDSEKEKGMFGTLVIALPSKHKGGKLIVRFDGRQESIAFSKTVSNYKMAYAAFYADCEHEITRITSGYRLCLVYNILRKSKSKTPPLSEFMAQTKEMAKLLKKWTNPETTIPRAVLLSHEYTPANFSMSGLKHHDLPRTQALIAAAAKAGFFAKLALVTHYQMGQLEGADDYYFGSRYRYRNYKKSSGGTMGEIYEEYTEIEHWGDDSIPGLGYVNIPEENLITNIQIGDGKPTEQEEEGYTGNAGMTMEYWYYYGAIVLWPKERHEEVLQKAPVSVKLQWLEYYAKHWKDIPSNDKKHTKKLVSSIAETETEPEDPYNWRRSRHYRMPDDYTSLAKVLIKINDKAFIKGYCLDTLSTVCTKITTKAWLQLLQHYDAKLFSPVFLNVGTSGDIFNIHHLFTVVQSLIQKNGDEQSSFAIEQIKNIPNYLITVSLNDLKKSTHYSDNKELTTKKAAQEIIVMTLSLAQYKAKNKSWTKNTLNAITKVMPRNYVNGILIPVLMRKTTHQGPLTTTLLKTCTEDLEKRVAQKPDPFQDWRRDMPVEIEDYYKQEWNILRPFMKSKTQENFDYVKNEQHRKKMYRAIRGTGADLKTQTIKRGSPYTLRITKTHASYERRLKEWQQDVKLLERVKKATRG